MWGRQEGNRIFIARKRLLHQSLILGVALIENLMGSQRPQRILESLQWKVIGYS